MKSILLIKLFRSVKAWGITILLLASNFDFGSNAFADDDPNDRTFSVMRQNLFMGTDFPELVAARSFDEFVQAVTTTYQNVLAALPTKRMAGIAQDRKT